MFVSHFNSLLDGGAATAARRLHAELLKAGVNSRLYYSASQGSRPELDASYHRARWGEQRLTQQFTSAIRFRAHRESFKRKVRGRPQGVEIFTSPCGAPNTPWPPVGHDISDPQIIHLHWVAKFLDYRSFFESLPKEQPVVWTLHDMNPFTGGCHFTEGCERFTEGCGRCPQLPAGRPKDISDEFFRIKRESLRDVNLHIVTASRWMQENAKRSPIFEHARSFHRIRYGLPIDRCQPVERSRARAELGLDPHAFVFAFGAVDIENRRKGAALLLESLQGVAEIPNAVGLVLGGGRLPELTSPMPPLQSMGFVKEIERRMLIYSACDLFVLPSTEDNMPLTGLEALASGTPIVAFDAGGIPDFVLPNKTGLLAAVGDAKGLGDQIRYMAQHPNQTRVMAKNSRQLILDQFQGGHESQNYKNLYATLLESAKVSRRIAA